MNDRWIYKEIQPYIHKANARMLVGIFNGILVNLVSLQNITKDNIMIGIVMDGDNPYQKKDKEMFLMEKLEKLSVTVIFIGWKKIMKEVNLEFDFGDTEPSKKRVQSKCTEIRSKGSLVVFPCSVWHRVCPS